MNAKSACLFVTALLLGAGGADAEKKELARFAGNWDLSSLTYDGEDHKLKFTIAFKGTEGKVEGNDDIKRQYAKIKFKLDPVAKPAAMDITIADGSQTDATMQAIYELKGDELRICAKVVGAGRPKDFAAPEGSSCVYLILKRAH